MSLLYNNNCKICILGNESGILFSYFFGATLIGYLVGFVIKIWQPWTEFHLKYSSIFYTRKSCISCSLTPFSSTFSVHLRFLFEFTEINCKKRKQKRKFYSSWGVKSSFLLVQTKVAFCICVLKTPGESLSFRARVTGMVYYNQQTCLETLTV